MAGESILNASELAVVAAGAVEGTHIFAVQVLPVIQIKPASSSRVNLFVKLFSFLSKLFLTFLNYFLVEPNGSIWTLSNFYISESFGTWESTVIYIVIDKPRKAILNKIFAHS
jgi:hypothetical protein